MKKMLMTLSVSFIFTLLLLAPAARSEAAKLTCKVKAVSKDGTVVAFEHEKMSGYTGDIYVYNKTNNAPVGHFYFDLSTSTAYLSQHTKKNQAYCYAARFGTYDAESDTFIPASDWSKIRYFTTISKYKCRLSKNKTKTVILKTPKIKGVSSYIVYLSTKKKSGFKKVKKVLPGKTVKLTRYKGKKFSYYQNYYYKIVPRVSAKDTFPYMDGFYIRRVFYK